MAVDSTVAQTVVTSPSYVLVPREDPLQKILFVVIVLVLGVMFFLALMTVLSAVLPRLRQRVRAALEERPWRSLATGIAVLAALGGLAAWFYSGAWVKLLLKTEVVPGMLAGGVGVSVLLAAGTLLGATGVIDWLGARLQALAGHELPGIRRTALATLLLVLACFFPVAGWFVMLPLAVAVSLGAFVLALVLRGN
jgi:hypothetical protein